ncbi:TetR/AcrR family transcriptional regulator [Specibacter sp. RAF43]|uniref:TetR/AcrR family transcriptional regulator n=1 Tax=Specibacter sp. RAF43 TaxID=3233057 RepID=UPI003F9466F9
MNKASSPRTKEERYEERFEELIAAAATVFAARGYADTTIQAIAREMNMTGAALYYYVTSKDELLYEIWKRAGAKLQAAIDEVRTEDLSAEEKLKLVFQRHLEVIIRDKPIFEVLILQRSRLPEFRREYLEEDERRYQESLTELIEAIPAERMRLPDSKVLALGVLALLNGVIRWYSPSERLSLQEISELYFEMFANGALKSPL